MSKCVRCKKELFIAMPLGLYRINGKPHQVETCEYCNPIVLKKIEEIYNE